MVSLDMRGLSKVLWVNAEDGVAMIEAGITGMDLKNLGWLLIIKNHQLLSNSVLNLMNVISSTWSRLLGCPAGTFEGKHGELESLWFF